jgi:TetR/AcrR family transcriptional repressor of nem operon
MARTKNFDELESLEKALNLFWRKGYNATSIHDLVETMGINRASIYATWGDKHSLYIEALKRYRQKSSSWLLNEIRTEQSALAIIRNFVYHTIETNSNDRERKGCFMVNASTELSNQDADVREIILDDRNTMEKVLSQLITEAQQSGEITSSHASQSLARFIFNSVSGLRVLSKGTISKNELTETVDVILSALD